MALQLGALREALVDAGAKPELAAKAAEELASYENRLGGIERQIVELRSHMDLRFAEVGLRFTEERAHTDQGFTELRAHTDQGFTELRAHTDQGFTELRAQMRQLWWVSTTTLGFALVIVAKLFIHG